MIFEIVKKRKKRGSLSGMILGAHTFFIFRPFSFIFGKIDEYADFPGASGFEKGRGEEKAPRGILGKGRERARGRGGKSDAPRPL